MTRDLQHAELRHLSNQIEALGGVELVGARAPSARAAVTAGEVALERQLPDRVDRTPAPIDVARVSGQRQVAPPRAARGRNR